MASDIFFNSLTLPNLLNFKHLTQTYCLNHIVARCTLHCSGLRTVLFCSLWTQLPPALTHPTRLLLEGTVSACSLGFVELNFQTSFQSGDWEMRAHHCTYTFITIVTSMCIVLHYQHWIVSAVSSLSYSISSYLSMLHCYLSFLLLWIVFYR